MIQIPQSGAGRGSRWLPLDVWHRKGWAAGPYLQPCEEREGKVSAGRGNGGRGREMMDD